ncbi:hypothetical protein [Evansella cellulosilytica]|uniref:Uncharacterized protein n=1 Tax=Evansella cellulosilytica (strain ATCC 21833 / DSM 2522 / FERM P-1141 / JCM 9156 / N-4) TaxID=649639 RepID=E6TZH4_EVAC2|nr:hypothetical protein [Evansella cellulosilytica]ADU30148.1 hypothetical protein Bcell_1886 [Evansella cellulosilytica DSM 2522]
MKLMQVLSLQPQKELVERVKSLGLTCNAHSRQQVTEELSKLLLNREKLKETWINLTQSEKHLLLQMSYGISLASYSTELLTSLRREDQHLFPSILHGLKCKGWIYEGENGHLTLPLELKRTIKQFTLEEWQEEFIILPRNKSQDYYAIYDLFEFMDTVSDSKVPLTKTKTIYKKQLLNILKLLSMEETIPTEKWRFGYGRHFNSYPDCFSFLYDFCFDQGWIVEGESLTVTEKWNSGQNTSINELLDRMLRVYIRIYRRSIPQLPFIVDLLTNMLSGGDAIEEKQLIHKIKDYVDPYYYDNPKQIVEKRIVSMLKYIHFLSLTEIDGNCYLQLNERLMMRTK